MPRSSRLDIKHRSAANGSLRPTRASPRISVCRPPISCFSQTSARNSTPRKRPACARSGWYATTSRNTQRPTPRSRTSTPYSPDPGSRHPARNPHSRNFPAVPAPRASLSLAESDTFGHGAIRITKYYVRFWSSNRLRSVSGSCHSDDRYGRHIRHPGRRRRDLHHRVYDFRGLAFEVRGGRLLF